jgi:3-polyprenyl-4-hydroxybenzoate decarboxylase
VRDSDTGAIVIKEALCVGCRACTLVCPYGAITMDTYRGVMLKCDLCSGDPYLKHVVVVDDDVDVYNETEVLWAISTRVQADEDVFIVAGVRGSDLDPSAKEQGIVTKVGIDATRTLLRPFPSRLKVPEKVMNKMKLEDFLE